MTREDAKAFMQKAWRETMKGSYAEEAYEMAIKALEQPTIEPPRKTDEWCSDCKEYDQEKHCCPRFNRVIRKTLSEQRKTGKWIGYNTEQDGWKRTDGSPVFMSCSECNGLVLNNGSAHWNYCPNCGAKMEVET